MEINKIQNITNSNTTNLINTNVKESINNYEIINKNIDKIKVVDNKDLDSKILSNKNSVNYENPIVIDNLSFGYNSETKDFYVKVKRGNIESQYPTEEMMKIKSFLQNLNKI